MIKGFSILTDFFYSNTGSITPVCLICSGTVALMGNETKHTVFDQKYPLKSELRSKEIIRFEFLAGQELELNSLTEQK